MSLEIVGRDKGWTRMTYSSQDTKGRRNEFFSERTKVCTCLCMGGMVRALLAT